MLFPAGFIPSCLCSAVLFSAVPLCRHPAVPPNPDSCRSIAGHCPSICRGLVGMHTGRFAAERPASEGRAQSADSVVFGRSAADSVPGRHPSARFCFDPSDSPCSKQPRDNAGRSPSGCRRCPTGCDAACANGAYRRSSALRRPARSPDRARAWRSTTARRRSP